MLDILHLEDDPLDSALVLQNLRKAGLTVTLDRVETLASFQQAVGDARYTLILSDYTIPGTDTCEALRLARERRPEVPFVFLSGTMGEDLGIELLKLGASDFVLKQRPERLAPAVHRALEEARAKTSRRQAERERRISQDRYRSLVQASAQAVWVADAQGQIVEDSPSWRAFTGQSYEQFRGGGWLEALHPDDRARVAQAWQEAVARRTMYQVEYRVRHASGAYRYMVVRGVPVLNDDGTIREWVGMDTDVTEQRQAQAALQTNEALLQKALAAPTVGVFFFRLDGQIHKANATFARMSGYSEEDLVKLDHWRRLTASEFWTATENAARSLAERGVATPYEKRMIRKDGSTWWGLFAPTRLSGQGWDTECVEFILDITQRQEAEEEARRNREHLAEAKRKLDAALIAGEIGTFEWDIARQRVGGDANFARMFGVKLDAGGMAPLADYIAVMHPDDQQRVAKRIARTVETGVDYEIEYRVITGGTTRWLLVRAKPERDAHGQVVRAAGVCLDVTDRRRAEEQLRLAKEEAENASRAKDHFLAVLSHELRTPLTPVVTTVAMLQNQANLDETVRSGLAMIRRNVEMEARLIDDLLDVTRIARGKIELFHQPLRLCTVIHGAVEVVLPDLEARGVQLDVDLGAAPYVVQGDATRLQQVFWNLLRNAVKFTPPGGAVNIRARREAGEHVTVEVEDTGEGIEPEALGRIFNAFEQAERTITRQFGGLGLGLTISKALVELHGGSIEAVSRGKGKGALFRVRLPLLAGHAVTETPPPPTAPLPPQCLRILLVEDHADTARVMRQLLTLEGHRVQHAADVTSALALARNEPFDLLISDLGLPDRSGLELIQELRAAGFALPAIALSGYGQEEDVRRSHDAGFTAHLTKPASPDRLAHAISHVFRPETER